jgi:hypothetical protein
MLLSAVLPPRSVLCLLGSVWLASCSATPASPTDGEGGAGDSSGGTTGNGSGGKGGKGGAPGSGGSLATGGNVGSGGSVGSGGTVGTGGTPMAGGAGGADASGGASGTDAGVDAGSGGAGGIGTPLPKFSFFVTSMAAMLKLAKQQDPAATMGFGGDLRYGQKDGLTGADKICTTIAESSMPGSGAKTWRAFLSATKGADGMPVNAADRIGEGPWYDRLGRVVAMTKAELLQNRPATANAAIKEDLPNETGTPNRRPDPTRPPDDNHHTLTGSTAQGKLYGQTATCMDWTTTSRDNQTTGRPRIGFSWSTGGRTNWISGQDEGGCGAGVTGVGTENGGSDPRNPIVGSGGGYGGIYCFALTP